MGRYILLVGKKGMEWEMHHVQQKVKMFDGKLSVASGNIQSFHENWELHNFWWDRKIQNLQYFRKPISIRILILDITARLDYQRVWTKKRLRGDPKPPRKQDDHWGNRGPFQKAACWVVPRDTCRRKSRQLVSELSTSAGRFAWVPPRLTRIKGWSGFRSNLKSPCFILENPAFLRENPLCGFILMWGSPLPGQRWCWPYSKGWDGNHL